jgi:hypothetical protein
LGRLGFLDNRYHTSNDLHYLKSIVASYKGDKYYKNELAVLDKNIITACGIAPIEFAKEVFFDIDLYPENHIEKWYQLFKNGVWDE